jgi:hypothetical protein
VFRLYKKCSSKRHFRHPLLLFRDASDLLCCLSGGTYCLYLVPARYGRSVGPHSTTSVTTTVVSVVVFLVLLTTMMRIRLPLHHAFNCLGLVRLSSFASSTAVDRYRLDEADQYSCN